MPVSTPFPSSAKLPSSSVRPALSLPPLQSLPAKGAKLNPVTMMYEKPIVGTPSSTAASAFLSTSTMHSPVRRGGRAETPPPRRASEPADAAKAAVAAKGKVIDKLLLRAVGGQAARGAARRPRNRRCPCYGWLGKRLLRDFSLAIIALCLFSCGNRDVFAGLGKATQAVAEVGEAAGNLAGASANATVAITGVAVDAVVVAASAAEGAWRGIGLLNISMTRQTCKVVRHAGYLLGVLGAMPSSR